MSSRCSSPPFPFAQPPPPPTPPNFDGVPDEFRAAYIRLKRKYEALLQEQQDSEDSEDSVNDSRTRPKKKKSQRYSEVAGRGIPRTVTLSESIQLHLIAEGDRRLFQQPVNEPNNLTEAEKQARQRRRDRTFRSYQLLLQLIPALQEKLVAEDVDEAELKNFVAKLQKKANSARADDILRIKQEVSEWLNRFNLESGVSSTPTSPFTTKNRANRGLENYITGLLLVPIDWDWNDPAVRSAAINRQLDLGSSFYYNVFYKGYKGDINDVEKGFLKSRLLIMTYQTIFTSPSSVTGNPTDDDEPAPVASSQQDGRERGTKDNVSTLLKMDDRVTPRSIAYAAVLLHFNLTTASKWRPTYYNVNYLRLYDFIVDFFEDPSMDDVAKQSANDLLSWWNLQIFPDTTQVSYQANTSQDILQQQRARKAAASVAEAGDTTD